MWLVRSFDLAVGTTVTGELVERVLQTVDAVVPLWAYFEESGHRKVSPIKRALGKFPSFERLVESKRDDGGAIRTSLPESRDAPAFAVELDRDTAIEIAHAIPKSLPFAYSTFVAAPVEELWLAPGGPPSPTRISSHLDHGEVGPAIVIRSSWGSLRRDLRLSAHLWMTPPDPDAAKLPDLPDATRRLLDQLGRREREDQHLVADPAEAAARESAEPAAAVLVDGVQLAEIALPVPDLANDEWHAGGDQTFGSFKDQLCHLLPRYRYHSTGRRGVWILTKRTAAKNELVLHVDRGPIGGNANATLTVRGPLWSHGWRLPASRTQTELRVWSAHTLASLCRNWVAVVETLERDTIPELERLYWPGFAWYSRGV